MMAAAKLNGYIELAIVAEQLGWQTQKLRRWLKREDAVFKKGRYWYTTRDRLRSAFPEIWEELIFSQEG